MKKVLLKTMLLLCALIVGSGDLWAAEGDILALLSNTAGSGYATRTTKAADNTYHVAWVLSGSNSGCWGCNSNQKGNVKPTAADLPVVKGVTSSATTNTQYHYFYYATTAVSNVGSVEFTFGNTYDTDRSCNVYLVMGDAKSAADGDAYTQVELSNSSTTAQGESISAAGTYTFTFAETQTSAKYYGLVIKVGNSSYKRFSSASLTFIEGATSSPAAVERPTFSVTPGRYDETKNVELSCTTEGATIHYTTNGDDPTSESDVYNGAIAVSTTTTIKAIAIKGSDESTIAEAAYTIRVANPTFSPNPGTSSEAQSVTLACSTSNASIKYTTDGSNPLEYGATYSTPISVTTTTTIKAVAIKDGIQESETVTGKFAIKPATPTISVSGLTVTIACETQNCDIRYTTNGDDPSKSSDLYEGAFVVEQLTTVRAIAYDAGGTGSVIAGKTIVAGKNINSDYYVKVTDVSSLKDGDAILIVNETAKKALGPQSGNNCPAKGITITNNTINDIGDAQKLILAKKNEKIEDVDTDVFYFYTGTGYLYAASSGSNYLKIQDPTTSNARATITITNGDATILFQGNSTHNLMQYNKNSNIFSSYLNAQTDGKLQIYKEVPAVTVSSARWTTYVAPENVYFPTEVTGYIASITNASSIHLTEISAAPKGTAVVIEADQGTYPLEVVDADACDDVDDNILQASDGSVTGNGNIYALGVGKVAPYKDQVGFFLVNTGQTVPAGKAYLTYSGPNAPSMLRIEDEVGVITNIENVEVSDKAVKFIENGQLLIKRDNIVYDTMGRIIR